MINRAAVKEESKRIMQSARVSPILVTLLVMIILFALERVSDLVRGGSPFYSYGLIRQYYDALLSGNPAALEGMLSAVPSNTGMTFFFSMLVSLAGLVLNGGYYIYCMGIRRGADALRNAGRRAGRGGEAHLVLYPDEREDLLVVHAVLDSRNCGRVPVPLRLL